MTLEKIISMLPSVNKCNISNINHKESMYIGAAGFEDRSVFFLSNLEKENKKLKYIIGIDYIPYNTRNQKNDYNILMNNISLMKTKWVIYDRYNPESILPSIREIFRALDDVEVIIIDISSLCCYFIH